MSYLASLLYNNLGTVSVLIITMTLVRLFLKPSSNLPPGPWAWPLIGHLPLMLFKDRRQLFKELRQKYGDIVYLCVGRQPLVLFSGCDVINEALSRRARDFGGRPQVFTTLKIGQGKGVVNSSGDTWHEHRQFLVKTMSGLGIGKSTFEKNVTQEITPFLQVVKSHSGRDFDCETLIQTAISNIVCTIAFGERFDYEAKKFEHLMNLISENMKLVGGTSFVNYFPFLENFPGDPCKCKQTLKTVDTVQKVTGAWVNEHKSTLDPDNPRDIIDLYLLHMKEKIAEGKTTTFNDSQLVKFVGDLLVAGTETTATTIMWSLNFLVRTPDVQAKVYEEIKATLEDRTTLSIHDTERMPYTMATISECQRLADIAPFCVPHSNPEAAEINGYTIPKGAVVLPVLNSLHHDPEVWEDPLELKPERFLDETRTKPISHKSLLPFGVGPRSCPGRGLARMELFFFLTSIVQHFHVQPSESEGIPSLEGYLGVTYVPKNHTLRFVPRSS